MQERLSARPLGALEDLIPPDPRSARPGVVLIASLTALALFVGLGVRRQAPLIEQDIRERATAAFAEAGYDWAQLIVDGRDITVSGVAPSAAARSAAYGVAAGLDGVRLARNRTALRSARPLARAATAAPVAATPAIPARPLALTLRSDGAQLALVGDVPDGDATAQLVEQVRRRFAAADVRDELTRAPSTAPAQWPAAAGAALEALVLLEHGEARLGDSRIELQGIAADAGLRARARQSLLRGAPDGFASDARIELASTSGTTAAECEAGIDALLAVARIEFDAGSADLRRDSTPVLEELGAMLQRCQPMRFEIAGHTDDRGGTRDNLTLSQRRAEAVMEYLVQHGVALRRLTARGYGEDRPVVRGTTAEARARNRRIEVHMEPAG
jgi:outer membrane protein OmpA-like peptidoglycan-associated protein